MTTEHDGVVSEAEERAWCDGWARAYRALWAIFAAANPDRQADEDGTATFLALAARLAAAEGREREAKRETLKWMSIAAKALAEKEAAEGRIAELEAALAEIDREANSAGPLCATGDAGDGEGE